MIWAISAGQERLAKVGERALQAGVDRLLVREPRLPPGIEALCERYGPRIVLHATMQDAIAIARATGAGVHLPGGEDPAKCDYAGPLGVSCHSPEEAKAVLLGGCDWVFLSPIFRPLSKPSDTRPVLGPEALVGVGAIALGGIDLSRVAACREHGAIGVATMSGILSEPDPALAAGRWKAAWGEGEAPTVGL